MKVRRLLSMLCLMLLLILTGCGGNPSDSGDEDEDPASEEPPTEDTTPPSSPGGLDGTSGDQMVELFWNDNSEDDLDGYKVYRSEESFSSVSEMEPINRSLVSDAEFSDEDLENGTTYYYRVTAVDENENESNPSPELELTPFSNPPDRP